MLHAWSIWDAEANFDAMLESARRALSLFQHHDGVTGTARDHVVKDYAQQMMNALKACKFVMQQAVYRHLTKPTVSFNSQRHQITLIRRCIPFPGLSSGLHIHLLQH